MKCGEIGIGIVSLDFIFGLCVFIRGSARKEARERAIDRAIERATDTKQQKYGYDGIDAEANYGIYAIEDNRPIKVFKNKQEMLIEFKRLNNL